MREVVAAEASASDLKRHAFFNDLTSLGNLYKRG